MPTLPLADDDAPTARQRSHDHSHPKQLTPQTHKRPHPHTTAGTTIEDKGKTPEEIFESDIAPLVAARPDLWPAAGGYPLFRRAAELVQSRAFHMRAENWVTGAVQVRSEIETL